MHKCVCVCAYVCGGLEVRALGRARAHDKKVTGRHTCAALFFPDFESISSVFIYSFFPLTFLRPPGQGLYL